MNNTGQTLLSNFIWRFLERVGDQAVSLIISIVLARILSPTDYGTVALINVFINILAVFIGGGLNSALIQKKDADDLDFSSVFYAQMVICIILYGILFFAAPHISSFYEKPEMIPMIRVLGLTFIISGIKNVQTAYVSRKMIFKKFFFATLGGTICAAAVGITMALNGFGAWALIVQSLTNNSIDTIILWFTVKWRPKRLFSFERLLVLFSFGWKMLVSGLLDTGYNNIRALVIGKIYSPTDLAYYDKGKNWPNVIISNVNSSIDSVLFPSMSMEQDDKIRLKAMTRRAIKTSTYIMSPLLIGLAACSTPLVRFILTEKWLPIVPFQVIFCITYVFYPIHTANLNAIKAMGRSDLFLKLEILKKVVGLALLAISAPISVMAIGYSLLVGSVICQIINTWPNKKLLDYGYLEQLIDILPGILLATLMGFCVHWFRYLPIHDALIVLVQICVGAWIYIGGSAFFKLESFYYMLNLIKGYFEKKAI